MPAIEASHKLWLPARGAVGVEQVTAAIVGSEHWIASRRQVLRETNAVVRPTCGLRRRVIRTEELCAARQQGIAAAGIVAPGLPGVPIRAGADQITVANQRIDRRNIVL